MQTRSTDFPTLVVAQTPGVAQVCRDAGLHFHWEKQRVENGESALPDQVTDFGLIIAETNLPPLDALDLIRSAKKHAEVPTIVISPDALISDGSGLLGASGVAFLAASTVPKELHRTLLHLLGEAPREQQSLFASVTLSINTAEAMKTRINLGLADNLEALGILDRPTRMRLELAFQEALTNSLEHGNLELDSSWKEIVDPRGADKYSAKKAERLSDPIYAKRKVVISFEFCVDTYSIRLRDEGPGFVPPPNDLLHSGANGLKCSGRGLAIIDGTVDDFSYSENGREILMQKRLGRLVEKR